MRFHFILLLKELITRTNNITGTSVIADNTNAQKKVAVHIPRHTVPVTKKSTRREVLLYIPIDIIKNGFKR